MGVDIAAKTFTAAFALGEGKPTLEKKPFDQTSQGFSRFLARLCSTGIAPTRLLVVTLATGPYWVALALPLAQAGYQVCVANPAQVHYCARLSLNGRKVMP